MVKVTIEKASPVLSPAYLFNDNIEEETIRAVWLRRYGVMEHDGGPEKLVYSEGKHLLHKCVVSPLRCSRSEAVFDR